MTAKWESKKKKQAKVVKMTATSESKKKKKKNKTCLKFFFQGIAIALIIYLRNHPAIIFSCYHSYTITGFNNRFIYRLLYHQ